MVEKEYKVTLHLKDGVAINHTISDSEDVEIGEAGEDDLDPEVKVAEIADSGFSTLFRQINKKTAAYFDFIPIVMSLAQSFSPHISTVVPEFLSACGNEISRSDSEIEYSLNQEQLEQFSALLKALDVSSEMYEKIPRYIILGLVATLDFHLLELFRVITRSNPSCVFSEERKISISEVLNCGSLEGLKEHVIETEIDKISRDTLELQIKWVCEKSGLDDVSKKYHNWGALNEIIERRNLFAHNDGIVNQQYLSKTKKLGFSTEVKVGEKLGVSQPYYSKSVKIIDEFCVFLTQVVWRKLNKNTNFEIELADQGLNSHAFELISRGEYEHSKNILEFAVKLRDISSEKMRKMMLVNLANAEKLLGNEGKSLELLNKEDWTVVNDEFAIVVASLKGEVTQVAALIRSIGSNHELIGLNQYQCWPVFFHVREENQFKKAILEVFGVDFNGQQKIQDSFKPLIKYINSANEDKKNIEGKVSLTHNPPI